jgi:hypothetical protein
MFTFALLHCWYNQLLTSSAFWSLFSFALPATALSAVPPPPKVAAVVDTILALVLVIQGAALHIQLAKAAMVAAVVEIGAPSMTRVAAAWSVVLVEFHWG